MADLIETQQSGATTCNTGKETHLFPPRCAVSPAVSRALCRPFTGLLCSNDGGRPAVRAFFAFFPFCNTVYPERERISGPVRIHTGELDDWTPAAPCVHLAQQLKGSGQDATVTVYPGAHHSFDNIGRQPSPMWIAARIAPFRSPAFLDRSRRPASSRSVSAKGQRSHGTRRPPSKHAVTCERSSQSCSSSEPKPRRRITGTCALVHQDAAPIVGHSGEVTITKFGGVFESWAS
jgi:hypothetical protein